jgi:hypothetical protein
MVSEAEAVEAMEEHVAGKRSPHKPITAGHEDASPSKRAAVKRSRTHAHPAHVHAAHASEMHPAHSATMHSSPSRHRGTPCPACSDSCAERGHGLPWAPTILEQA